jgi:hypothetical protein
MSGIGGKHLTHRTRHFARPFLDIAKIADCVVGRD